MDNLTRFMDLHGKFERGRAWLSRRFQGHILNDGSRRFNPELERDIKDFEEVVMKPMDSAWRIMAQGDKDAAWAKIGDGSPL